MGSINLCLIIILKSSFTRGCPKPILESQQEAVDYSTHQAPIINHNIDMDENWDAGE
jgi:hypothetical protein